MITLNAIKVAQTHSQSVVLFFFCMENLLFPLKFL